MPKALKDKRSASTIVAWCMLAAVVLPAFIAWGDGFDWKIEALGIYSVFPLLGLLAWSIMWTHYAYGALTLAGTRLKSNVMYRKTTGYAVLGLILLHPGLLAIAQWDSARRLPPGSYSDFVGPALITSVILGEIALAIFLSYEVFERLRNKPALRRHWKWVSLLQMLAMSLIFFHSLRLGSTLQAGWFRYYWIALGLLLIPSFILVGIADWQKSKQE